MKFIFVFMILAPCTLRVHGQTYYFMNDSAEWKVDYSYIPGNYECFQCEYKYYLAGDTIISTIHYKKLRRSTLEQGSNFSDKYEGAIRQDTIAKKVFFYGWNGFPSEELLYDYSLDTGDTIQSWIGNDWIIFAVDSVLIGSKFHKRMKYGIGIGDDTLALIEGVGSENGLLQSLYDNMFESYAFLTCFSLSGNLLYTANQQFLDNNGCDVSNPLHIPVNYGLRSTRVFPNPASTTIHLLLPSTATSITLFNLLGEKVKEEKVSGDSVTIDVSDLAIGMYVIRSEEMLVGMLAKE